MERTTIYQCWLASLSDRQLSALWSDRAAPRDGGWKLPHNVARMAAIHDEMADRGLIGADITYQQ